MTKATPRTVGWSPAADTASICPECSRTWNPDPTPHCRPRQPATPREISSRSRRVKCRSARLGSGSAYVLPPQVVNATPSARVVVSRWEVCGVENPRTIVWMALSWTVGAALDSLHVGASGHDVTEVAKSEPPISPVCAAPARQILPADVPVGPRCSSKCGCPYLGWGTTLR